MIKGTKMIIGERQSGKTTKLLEQSAESRFPIVVSNKYEKDKLIRMAADLGLEIPEPIIFYINPCINTTMEKIRGQRGILVDNLEYYIDSIFGNKFAGGTIGDGFVTSIEKLPLNKNYVKYGM